jgi:hypothetical protein
MFRKIDVFFAFLVLNALAVAVWSAAWCGCSVWAVAGMIAAAAWYFKTNAYTKRHMVTVSLVFVSLFVGGKPIVQETLQRWLIVALYSGGIKDPSGTVGSATEAATVRAYAEDSVAVVDSAAVTLSNSLATLRGLTNVASVPVSYLASDMPRAIPGTLTNHNVIATIERTQDDGTNLSVFVWFSRSLASAPKITWRVSTSETATYTLQEVTNSYPQTISVDGTECVRYVVSIPQNLRGIPFRPRYELGWGGSEPSEYLGISSLGASVIVAGREHLPYTGADTYDVGGEPLRVTYSGGIAVAAFWKGTNYTERGKAK